MEVKGDGYCDDATNIPICEYDGGDCCLPNVQTDYCVECLCLETDTAIIASTLSATISTCLAKHLIGDGYCDDDTNNMICNYDGGDCCFSVVNTAYCEKCQCLGKYKNDCFLIQIIYSAKTITIKDIWRGFFKQDNANIY